MTEPTQDPVDVPEAATGPDRAGREAAKYRHQLRDVETERDTLRDHLTTARRTITETHLGNVTAAAFWQMHPEVADLLGEDGQVDPAKVTDAARAVHAELGLPGVFSNTRKGAIGPYVPNEGAATGDGVAVNGWTDAFKPKTAAGDPIS